MTTLPLAIQGNLCEYAWRNPVSNDTILALWRAGFDTLDIARVVHCPESTIANRLPSILHNARIDRDWEAA